MVTGGTAAGVLAEPFSRMSWDFPNCSTVPFVQSCWLWSSACMIHWYRLSYKCIKIAHTCLKHRQKTLLHTISAYAISAGHLQECFLCSSLAALGSLLDSQILHPDVNHHTEAYKQGLSAGLCTVGTVWENVWVVQNPHLKALCSRVKCCAVKPARRWVSSQVSFWALASPSPSRGETCWKDPGIPRKLMIAWWVCAQHSSDA